MFVMASDLAGGDSSSRYCLKGVWLFIHGLAPGRRLYSCPLCSAGDSAMPRTVGRYSPVDDVIQG